MSNIPTFKARLILAFFFMAAISAKAADLPQPTGETILTVSGAVSNTNSNGTLIIDLEMLENLPQSEFTTSTIWTDDDHTFVGISLLDLAEFLGASGSVFHAIAINDYAVDIPFSDAVENGPIIAYLMDGAALSPRDKGPLWIVYPFDTNESYRSEQVYSRSIWQLDRIEILE